jgi:hypothetical protein
MTEKNADMRIVSDSNAKTDVQYIDIPIRRLSANHCEERRHANNKSMNSLMNASEL